MHIYEEQVQFLCSGLFVLPTYPLAQAAAHAVSEPHTAFQPQSLAHISRTLCPESSPLPSLSN